MLIVLNQSEIETSLNSVRRAMKKANLLKPNRRSPDGLTTKSAKSKSTH